MSRAFTIALALVLVAGASRAEDTSGEAEPPKIFLGAKDDVQMRQLLVESLEAGLRAQVKHYFEVWMKDPTGQPERAANGIRRSVAAYRHAVEAINKATAKHFTEFETPQVKRR